MIVHFIYLVGKKTPSFKLIHYLVIKSWLVNNPSYKVCIWTNDKPTYSTWWIRLFKEFGTRITIGDLPEIIESFPEYMNEAYEKASHMAHKADILRLNIMYKFGGVYCDLDHICLKSFQDIFLGDTPVYPCELDVDHHFEAIPNGLFYAPAGSSWISELMELYKNYNPESWNETSILKPTELYFEDKGRIKVIPAGLVDPVTYRYDDWHSFFFHNGNLSFKDSLAVHVSESVTKEVLRLIDLTHIMTVDTNFTKLVRPLVSEYWDFENNTSLISKYE